MTRAQMEQLNRRKEIEQLVREGRLTHREIGQRYSLHRRSVSAIALKVGISRRGWMPNRWDNGVC